MLKTIDDHLADIARTSLTAGMTLLALAGSAAIVGAGTVAIGGIILTGTAMAIAAIIWAIIVGGIGIVAGITERVTGKEEKIYLEIG